jgi:hypothetical protein
MPDIYRFQDSCRMRRVIVAEATGKRTARRHEWRDSFRAILARIRHEPADRIDPNFPTIEDGVKGLAFVEAAIRSSVLQNWQFVKVPSIG